MTKKVVIVGGVAGGASTAARLRRLDESANIVMLERGPFVSFANCGLPYYVGNVIKNRDKLELMTPQDFLARFNIDVRVKNEAISIDRNNKKIKVEDIENNKNYDLDFDYLVLSPGAEPIKPNFEGIADVPIFTLRNIPDTIEIEEFITNNNPRNAVVVGGGFIGIEMAENLAERGIFVTLVELLDQVMMPLDKEMAQFVHQNLCLNGVEFILSDGVASFSTESQNNFYVITQSGRKIKTDLVILAIGVKPESKLAKNCSLDIGNRGHIIVNNKMQTSDSNIYAVGDAVQVTDFIDGKAISVPLAGPANKQGRIAADNIAGRNSNYDGVLGTSVVKVFDLVVSTVGWNEKKIKESGIKYEKIYLHPNNHAGYYPNAQPLSIKLLFEFPRGKILGAQIIGGPGTEKRIDIISTVIHFGGTVFDLEKLELSYAPPFSSAKDPINMAGFIASNVLKGDMKIWHWHDFDGIKKNNGFIVDVRTKEEYDIGHIENAINISDKELRKNINKIPKDKQVYIYCQVGFRGYLAYRILYQLGYNNISNLSGGIRLFEVANSTPGEIKEICGDPKEIIEQIRKEKDKVDSYGSSNIVQVDACGLACPGPINSLINSVKKTESGKIIEIKSTDPSFSSSVKAWTDLTDGVNLLTIRKKDGIITANIKKTKQDIVLTIDEEPEHEEFSSEEKISEETVLKQKKGRLKPLDEPPYCLIEVNELYERSGKIHGPAVMIDVRPRREIRANGGKIPNSIIIPLGDLMNSIEDIEEYKEEEIVTICHSGARSMMAAQILAKEGFKDIRSLNGGIMIWFNKGYKLEKI